MKISEITQSLDKLVPLHLAEEYDNVGLLVGEPDQALTGILVALDITTAVQQEALKNNANLIVTHHPIWFRSRKNLIGKDFAGRQIRFAIENRLNLYACHTNLDNIQTGVNKAIVEKLKLQNTSLMDYKPAHGPDSVLPAGAGMIGSLAEPVEELEFLNRIKSLFKCKILRYRSGPGAIQKVAVCGGSGDFLLESAVALGADAFLTGDIGYHRFFDADDEILIVDLGHFESEQFTVDVIKQLVLDSVDNIPVHISKEMKNPVSYL